ncbi:MAG: VOC family protein [Saprospiraceae bacterium]|uniref:VOC family protein n=1 Tax=Candidatus Opimibacter skivensis TaxID=2982028 RepID=A0A9D7SSJ4_9BACT|nr:VOC family protein [Candidatus Opimibacter skivensis]
MNNSVYPFHLAIPVDNLAIARQFYHDVMKCKEGRTSELWTDYDLYGHQLVIHYQPKSELREHSNPVDGHDVPIPHFGVVLPWKEWEDLAQRLKDSGIQFIIEPYIRFKGLVGEQATMFFKDPCGNALEFKAFKDINQLFAR